jgi:hypothetical protein
MRELDSESRLNPMVVFCEYAHVDASGLGMGNRLHVGDNTWSAGLRLELRIPVTVVPSWLSSATELTKRADP